MNYDPKSRSVTASGNVRFVSPEGELFSDEGTGFTDGRTFEMRGNVRGNFRSRSLDITCDSLEMESQGASPVVRRITGSGAVKLVRGGDSLTADRVTWETGRENYRASGSVKLRFGDYFLDSDEAARNEGQFWARNVRRYEDRARELYITASKASGLVRNGSVVELIADGNLVIDMRDSRGDNTRITGERGVFSQDRGTLVISGGARAIQPGRDISAANIVYHLGSGRVEALGERPTITFEMRD
jgi:lipopolysaccharide export system protein LptA